MKPSRVVEKGQHVARDQKYPIKTTFKEARLKRYRFFDIIKNII